MSKCCGTNMIKVEIPEVYDGAIYHLCRTCHRAVHRFPADHWIGQRARQWAATIDGVIEEPAEVIA